MKNKIRLEQIFLGKAIFTMVSIRTGDHRVYKITQSKDNEFKFFVSMKIDGAFMFVGLAYKNESGYKFYDRFKSYKIKDKSKEIKISAETGIAAINLLIENFNVYMSVIGVVDLRDKCRWENIVELISEGLCLKCGRSLQDPKSQEIGIGPECRKQLELHSRKI